MDTNSNKKIAFFTLGCKLNFSETSTIARAFVENGYQKVAPTEVADIYVINTCSVTEQADKKCRQIIRKFIKQAPDAIVAVTGCYAQLKPQEVAAIPGVDLVLGADAKGQLFEYVNQMNEKGKAKVYSCEINKVESFFKSYSSGDRTRSFMKVQDGCSYQCSYCTIPLARGKSRNISIEQLLVEARNIAANGTKEIILTGVNIGDFGRSNGERFIDLLTALDAVEGIERYRISSIEPNLLTHEIIELIAQSTKFLPHFHIPLQSGSNKILNLMKRRYQRETFADRLDKTRQLMPNAFFGVDVIVGFPGETDEDFEETFDFLRVLQPSFLHVFPYSERPNTLSASLPNKVDEATLSDRAKRLNTLSAHLHRLFYTRNIGAQAKVLFESTRQNGNMFGYTTNYIKVETPYNKALIGKIVEVKLTGIAASENMEIVISE